MSTAIIGIDKMATSRSLLLLLLKLLLLLHPCNGLEAVIESAPPAVESSPQIQRRLHGGGVHREFFCSIQYTEVTHLAMNETVGKFYDINGTADNTANPPQITYAAKACACYGGILNSTYYCPADSNYCSISLAYDYHSSYIASRIDGHDPTVTCFRDTQLKGFARYVWKYCTIILAALVVVLVFTDTGRVSAHIYERTYYFIDLCPRPFSLSSRFISLTLSYHSMLQGMYVRVAIHKSTQDISNKD